MGSKAVTDASATNTNTSSVDIGGSIGLTGADFREAISILTGGTVAVAQTNAFTAAETSRHILGASVENGRMVQTTSADVAQRGFSYSQYVQGQSYDLARVTQENSALVFDRSVSRATDTIAGLINASRDFSQRAIAAGTGQATPLQFLPAAENSTPTLQQGGSNIPIIIGVVVVASVFLLSKGK